MIPFPQTKRLHAVADIAERVVRASVSSASFTPLVLINGVTITRKLLPAADNDGL
jgi:hypothetical protein